MKKKMRTTNNLASFFAFNFDEDFQRRILFGRISLTKDGETVNLCIPELFTDLGAFFKFISYVQIEYDYPGNSDSLKKSIDNLNIAVAKNLKALDVSVRKIAVHTGLFEFRESARFITSAT